MQPTDDLVAGNIATLRTGVRRIVAPNPSLMTGPGTNTYILGAKDTTIIDPGPPIAAHVERLIAASGGAVQRVLVTHTHPDHSPAARLLADACGAELLGMPAPAGRHQDKTFTPDRTLVDGDTLALEGGEVLRVMHTPGHASNHLCYLLAADRWLFTGDHIINGSTVVIDPPDGNMRQYVDALVRLRNEQILRIAPGHGAVIDAPDEAIGWLIEHRLKREAIVVHELAAHPECTLEDLVVHVYAEVDANLHKLAQRSLLAHLLKLEEEGRAQHTDGRWCLR